MLGVLGQTLYVLASLYTFVLLARVILDWARVLAPSWHPRGPILFLADWVYRLTDPPLRALGRLIPPLRLGAIALDVGFIVLFVAVTMVGRLGFWLASGSW